MVGIKQGDLNPTAIDQIANACAGVLRLFCASDLAFLGPMMAGFDGISTTNSGALPELIVNTFRAVERRCRHRPRFASAVVRVSSAGAQIRAATAGESGDDAARL